MLKKYIKPEVELLELTEHVYCKPSGYGEAYSNPGDVDNGLEFGE